MSDSIEDSRRAAAEDLVRASLREGRSFRFVIRGRSMAPRLRDGDIAVVEPAGSRAPSPGALVLFRHPESGLLVVHRLIGKSRRGLRIMGDACRLADRNVPGEALLGVVTAVERGGRVLGGGLGTNRRWLRIRLLTRSRIWMILNRLRGRSRRKDTV